MISQEGYVFVQTKNLLTINNLEINKISTQVNQNGISETNCRAATTIDRSKLYPLGLAFNSNEGIIWSAGNLEREFLLIQGISTSDCSAVSEAYKFTLSISDI